MFQGLGDLNALSWCNINIVSVSTYHYICIGHCRCSRKSFIVVIIWWPRNIYGHVSSRCILSISFTPQKLGNLLSFTSDYIYKLYPQYIQKTSAYILKFWNILIKCDRNRVLYKTVLWDYEICNRKWSAEVKDIFNLLHLCDKFENKDPCHIKEIDKYSENCIRVHRAQM